MTDTLSPEQFAPRAGMLGRLPVKPPEERFPLNWAHDYLAAPVPGPSYPIDVSGGITDWGMLGNDQEGDCGEAGIRHIEMSTAVGIEPIPSFTTQEALDEYHAFTGGADTGVNLADFLLWLFNKGRIKAFAPVDHTNVAQADALMAEFKGLYVGVSLTDDAQQLFPSSPWTTANGETADPSLGHCIAKVKADGTMDGWVTWGTVQQSTIEWSSACVDEIWLVITTEEQLAKFVPELVTEIQALGGKVAPANPQPVPEVPSSDFQQKVDQLAQEAITAVENEIERVKTEAEAEVARLEKEIGIIKSATDLIHEHI